MSNLKYNKLTKLTSKQLSKWKTRIKAFLSFKNIGEASINEKIIIQKRHSNKLSTRRKKILNSNEAKHIFQKTKKLKIIILLMLMLNQQKELKKLLNSFLLFNISKIEKWRNLYWRMEGNYKRWIWDISLA